VEALGRDGVTCESKRVGDSLATGVATDASPGGESKSHAFDSPLPGEHTDV
jgi:hypothetical protein